MTRRSRLFRTISIISQSCCVERHSRDTSKVTMVSPGCDVENISDCCALLVESPCSYSIQICSAPAWVNSRICRSISCLLSHVEHRAYPCVTETLSAVFVTAFVSIYPLSGPPKRGPQRVIKTKCFWDISVIIVIVQAVKPFRRNTQIFSDFLRRFLL